MKTKAYSILLFSLCFVRFSEAKDIYLSRDVFRNVPFSSQYSEDGAVIKNVYFPAVNALVEQLNDVYGLRLEDRGEAHITVITPPEYKNSLSKAFSIQDLLSRYRFNMQAIPFEIVCIGSRKSSDGQKLVFYLVVKSPQLFAMRNDLAKEAINSGFEANAFWPHITIGYVKGDVFEFTKGPESCITDIRLIIH